VVEAEALIDGFASDIANKLKSFLGMLERARHNLYENEITTVVQSKRGDVKRCKLDLRKPYVYSGAATGHRKGAKLHSDRAPRQCATIQLTMSYCFTVTFAPMMFVLCRLIS